MMIQVESVDEAVDRWKSLRDG